MHFFRTLWSDGFDSTPFAIKDSIGEILEYKNIVIQDDANTKYLSYTESIQIYYYSKWSKINFPNEEVYFARDGFFDPTDISWEGELGRKRIGDSLPYEYTAEQ